jgi:hypothetical protein
MKQIQKFIIQAPGASSIPVAAEGAGCTIHVATGAVLSIPSPQRKDSP